MIKPAGCGGWPLIDPLIDSLALPDPEDRHVLAAAIRAGAKNEAEAFRAVVVPGARCDGCPPTGRTRGGRSALRKKTPAAAREAQSNEPRILGSPARREPSELKNLAHAHAEAGQLRVAGELLVLVE
jgi:hypothetical protein